jgi:MFS family permease
MSFASAHAGSPSRWRDVSLAAAARGVSYAGDMLSATALLLVVQGRGAGGSPVAALLLAASAPLVLLAPLTGRLVDRADSRLVITTAAFGQAACCVAMAYVRSTPVLVGLVALVAAGAAITQPTFAALLPEMVRREDLPRAVAIGQTAGSVGMLIGPALAGLLVGLYGQRIPLLLDAVTFLWVAVAALLITTRRRHPSPARRSGKSRSRQNGGPKPANDPPSVLDPRGWTIRRDRLLLPVVVMVGLAVGALSLVNVVDVFFVRETLHASTTMYGLTSAAWTGSLMIGSWLVARRKGLDDAGFALLMAVVLGLDCAVIAVGGLVPNVGWLVPLWVLGGAGNGAINSIAAVLLSRRAPAAVRGRAFAHLGAVANAANMAGYVLGGALVGPVAPGALLVGSGLLGVAVVGACTLPMLRAARQERARPADGAALTAPATVGA